MGGTTAEGMTRQGGSNCRYGGQSFELCLPFPDHAMGSMVTNMLVYALWGLSGGFAIEALEFRRAIRRTRTWPWRSPEEPTFGPWLCAVIVRLLVGAIVAGAARASDQLSGPFAAIAVGVAAPVVLEQLARQARLAPPAPSDLDTAQPVAGPETAEGGISDAV
jgi:hypothetical protein